MPSVRDPFLRRAGRALAATALLLAVAPGVSEAQRRPRPVTIVCWDGASWPLLDPLLEAQHLPSLRALLQRGRSAKLSLFEPPVAAAVATTLATGLPPALHGVADPSEIDPARRRLRAASALSRAVPGIWDIASARGLRVAVIGWPATWPAERVTGFVASDRLLDGARRPEALRGFPALAWPASVEAAVGRLAAGKRTAGALGDLLDGIRVRFGLALEQSGEADLVLLFVPEPARAARLLYDPAAPTADSRAFPAEVETLLVETDRLLGALVAQNDRRGGDLFLASASGLRWAKPQDPLPPAPAHRAAEGILVAAGPDVVGSRVRTQASVFDVAPTVARLLGLPLDPRATGSELSAWISAGAPAAPARRRWDEVATAVPVAPGIDAASASRDAREHAASLGALGYLVPTGTFHPAAGAPLRSPAADANLAMFLRSEGRTGEALARLRQAVAAAPETPAYRELLADVLESTGAFRDADAEALAAARARGAAGTRAVTARAQRRVRAGRRAEAYALLGAARTRVPEPGGEISMAYGRLALEVGHAREALRVARILVKLRPQDPACWDLYADASERSGAPDEGRRARAKAASLARGAS